MNQTKQKSNKSALTKKELEVLILIYRFRFLNRVHIQAMLGHKSHTRVQTWLDSLVKHGCLTKEYEKKITNEPAIYYLSALGRKQLKKNPEVETKLLNSRTWRENERTKEFIEHCLFVDDICVSLMNLAESSNRDLAFYTKTDLYGISYVVKPLPDAYFALVAEDGDIKRYFLDVFDDVPSAQLRRRIQRYLGYYDLDKWFEKYPDKPFPGIILICPNTRMKGHLFYYIQSHLDEYPDLNFDLSTKELVKKKGMRTEILEKVNPEE